jgi:C-terminal processing protease CtpA/Prc
MTKRDDGVFVVPAPGEFVGLILGAPRADTKAEPESLPVILEVGAGSLAARKGVQVGDRLRALDGGSCAQRPASAWNPALWLRPGASLELELRARDGRVRTVTLR